MNSHAVTVVIPTYNRAPMLIEAVHSVLAQTTPVHEIIVADDGSTDSTAEVLPWLSGPIRHLRLPHSGRPSVARNRAAALATAPLIAFLDDDDLWEPHKLARQLPRLDNPAIGFVYSDVRLLYESGELSEPVLRPTDKREGNIFDALLDSCAITVPSVVMRRELFLTVGGFDETMASSEDFDLWLRVARVSRAAFVDEPLVQIRRHPGEISLSREIESYRNVIRSLERARRLPALSLRQRARVRRRLAQHHTTTARLLQQKGQPGSTHHLLAALRLNPAQPAAWRGLWRTLRAAR